MPKVFSCSFSCLCIKNEENKKTTKSISLSLSICASHFVSFDQLMMTLWDFMFIRKFNVVSLATPMECLSFYSMWSIRNMLLWALIIKMEKSSNFLLFRVCATIISIDIGLTLMPIARVSGWRMYYNVCLGLTPPRFSIEAAMFWPRNPHAEEQNYRA